jgi:hypothetical protein
MDTPPFSASPAAASDPDSALVASVADALVSASRLPAPPPMPTLLAAYLPRLTASHHPRVLSLAASNPGLASPDPLLAYRSLVSPPSCLPSLLLLLPALSPDGLHQLLNLPTTAVPVRLHPEKRRRATVGRRVRRGLGKDMSSHHLHLLHIREFC